MSIPERTAPPDAVASPLALSLVLLLFVASGCAALIDEIVWFQLLQLVIGSSAVSLGLLLGAFMGGMCLGSVALPRIVGERRHPLRVYALLELGIGLSALCVLFGAPYVGGLYIAFAGHGFHEILLRGTLCACFLLPPAFLMGATLPAIARWIETTPRGVSWLGFFYGGNTIGAVCGCLLAGFYLLRVYDMPTATYVAVAINLAIALVALALAGRMPHRIAGDDRRRSLIAAPRRAWAVFAAPRRAWTVYAAIGLSGMSALGAEVVWTRLFSLMLGGATYTFSIILAVFLAGIGVGSSLGACASRFVRRPALALGACQLSLVGAIAWTAWSVGNSFAYFPLAPGPQSDPWMTFAADLARCAWAMLPAACLWGASFPLALAALASRGQNAEQPGRQENAADANGPRDGGAGGGDADGSNADAGRLVGGVYAANTVGSIVGALGASLVLIPWIGTQQLDRVLMALAALAAVCVLAPLVWPSGGPADAAGGERRLSLRKLAGAAALAVSLVAAFLLARGVRPVPFDLIAYGREAHITRGHGVAELYRGEGMNSTIAVSKLREVIQFHVSGKVEASSNLADMRLERMLANIPAMLHPAPRSVLVVGFGAGVTAGAFLPYLDVERLVICEIEPLIPQFVGPFFSDFNLDVLHDPHVEMVYDDARHYVLTTREKFDIITSDPIHPYVKGAATLYTQEYFEQLRDHLNPGGLVSQWVPLYESSVETVKSEIATFLQVFPNGTVWYNTKGGEGYDLVLLGSVEPLRIDLDSLHERMTGVDQEFRWFYLEQVGFTSETDLLATYAGEGADFADWLKDAQINRDRNLRLQYLAGFVPKYDRRKDIYREMFSCRKFPEKLFTGSEARRKALRQALSTRPLGPI